MSFQSYYIEGNKSQVLIIYSMHHTWICILDLVPKSIFKCSADLPKRAQFASQKTLFRVSLHNIIMYHKLEYSGNAFS